MILEGLVTTIDADGAPHLAPMGPLVEAEMVRLILRPFRTSQTYRNLQRTGQGVFHITDDVELLARAAIHRLETQPPMHRARSVDGFILDDACRWFAFRVQQVDAAASRTSIACDVVDQGRIRDFLGFNRAKNAVIEAAILATRVDRFATQTIRHEFDRLAVIVEKTAGDQERRAFDCLRDYVQRALVGRTD